MAPTATAASPSPSTHANGASNGHVAAGAGPVPVKSQANGNGTASAPASGASTHPGATSVAGSSKIIPDFSVYLSAVAKNRPPSPIRSLFPAESIPGMLSLLAGKPNTSTFPFESISIKLKSDPSSSASSSKPLSIQGDDLNVALQYGATAGLPRLVNWLSNLVQTVHHRSPPSADTWKLAIGSGSQDLLSKTFEAILNPGDSILVESPVYAGILPCLTVTSANVVGVQSDAEGVSPDALRKTLANWTTNPGTATKAFPKVLYTTPTGANPSGTTASLERKRQILALVREFNILLMEDDPYYFLNFDGLGEDPATRPRPMSYFALEGTEGAEEYGVGRVLRFESFSKILSGGLRLGFMCSHPVFHGAYELTTASANLQVSGVAQAVVLSVLEHWGFNGFLSHCDRVSDFYRQRRDVFEGVAREVLGDNGGKQKAVADWVTPTAGMFLWLNLHLPPSSPEVTTGDSFDLVTNKAKAAGVLAVPGIAFMPDPSQTTCYVRTSFSLIPEEHFREAFVRLRTVILAAWDEAGADADTEAEAK